MTESKYLTKFRGLFKLIVCMSEVCLKHTHVREELNKAFKLRPADEFISLFSLSKFS